MNYQQVIYHLNLSKQNLKKYIFSNLVIISRKYINNKYPKKYIKIITVLCLIITTSFLILNPTNIVYAQKNKDNYFLQQLKVDSGDLIKILTTLITIFGTILVAFLGGGFGFIQLIRNERLKTWQCLLESLRWFEGGTQKRNIGIALVESEWDKHPEFQDQWTSILVNQGIYLLTREKTKEETQEDAFHEEANLYRIMNLLIDKAQKNSIITDSQRKSLTTAIQENHLMQQDSQCNLKLKIDSEILKEWAKKLNLQLKIQLSSSTLLIMKKRQIIKAVKEEEIDIDKLYDSFNEYYPPESPQ